MIIRVPVEIRTDGRPNTLRSAITWANLSGVFLQDFEVFFKAIKFVVHEAVSYVGTQLAAQ